MLTIPQKSLLLVLLAITFALSACNENWGIRGEGPVVEESRSLPEFHSVKISVPADVILRQGKQKDVLIEAQENVLNNLKTKVEDGKLEIRFEENVSNFERLNIYISIPEYRQVSLSGSGSVKTDNQLKGDELELTISGSGNMDIQAKYERLSSKISGSGDVNIAGRGQYLDLRISGSGNINALSFEAEEVEVKVSGSGDVEVNVKERLKASIAGSGDLKYKGRPVVQSSTSGSGSVSSID